MANMPTLGRQRRTSRGPIIVALLVAAAALFVARHYWKRAHAPKPEAPAPLPAAAPPPAVTDGGGSAHDGGAAPSDAGAPAARSPIDEELAKSGLKRLRVEISGALETAVVRGSSPEVGQRLVQVLVRPLVWWIAVPMDIRRGDVLDALYEERPGQDPVLHAIRFRGGKAGRLFRAYRYKAAASEWPRLYTPDAAEVELRIKDAPVADYEQITSLLRDGRGHKGVDFKTPLGTPIRAPFDAVVARKEWKTGMNGHSLELHESGGHGWTVELLHLAEPSALAVGAKVARGEVVAKSGNSGHSFAPHLHYQLMAGQTVLDPFVAQETERRTLPPEERAAFSAEVARFDKLLGPIE